MSSDEIKLRGQMRVVANWIIVAILLRLSDTVRNVPTEAIDE